MSTRRFPLFQPAHRPRHRARHGVWQRGGALLIGAALAGCVPQIGEGPQMSAPAQYASARALSLGPVADAWPADRWWTAYGDPQLDRLVDEALANSPTVAQAAARLRVARASVAATGAADAFQLNAAGTAGLKKQSYNNGIPADFVPKGWKGFGQLSLAGDFDLDLWGRRRAELAAATSEALAAQVDARQAALALASSVVEAYARLGVLYQDRDLLAAQLGARRASAELYAKRYRAGLDSQLPEEQARAAAAGAAADLAAVDERIALERNVLAALVGAGPDRGLAITRPTASGPFARIPVPADAGIALAGRRPDIVAARLRAEAADKRITAARAAFLPDVSLSGLVGLMSLGIGNLFDGGSTFGDTHAAFSLPLIDGGARKANLETTLGTRDLRVAEYNATVIDALKDVADALASRAGVEAQSAEADRAAAAAARGHALAERRYRAGLTTYLDVLTAQTAMIAAQQRALDTRARLVLLDIQLVRALGGGYADTSAIQTGSLPR